MVNGDKETGCRANFGMEMNDDQGNSSIRKDVKTEMRLEAQL